jgi:hypothetical protein
MSRSLEFDEPIALPKDKALRTLREAGEHVAALPRKEAALPHWQLAVQCLLSAAEHGGIVMMARIAMLRALTHGQEQPAEAPAQGGEEISRCELICALRSGEPTDMARSLLLSEPDHVYRRRVAALMA